MLVVAGSKRRARAKVEWLDRFFDLCSPMNGGRTIGVGRSKNNIESLRKELASIAMSAVLLRDILIPLGLAECFARGATSVRKRRILPQRQLRNARDRGGWDSGHRSTCSSEDDAVVHFSSSERTDSRRTSSTCTRGGSRQTRMYRS
jgi:hypothetical protein